MSRNGSGVYSMPAGTAAVSGATIDSDKYNTLMDDFETDANTARPIVAGGTGATTAAAARTNLLVAEKVLAKSANYTLVAADRSSLVRCSAAITLALPAAATAGDGWYFDVSADGGDVTIDPNGSETVDGSATLTIPKGATARIKCNATAFFSQFFARQKLTFASHSAFTTWAASNTPTSGATAEVKTADVPGVVKFVYDGSTALFTGLTGWAPVGVVWPAHAGASTASSDNATSLQEWFNAIKGGIPGAGIGTYAHQSALSLGAADDVQIDGAGLILNYTGATTTTNPIWHFGGSAAQSIRWRVSGICFTSATTMTAGVGLLIERVQRSKFRDMIVDGQDGTGKLYHGIWIKNCDTFLWDGGGVQAQQDGIQLSGTAGVGAAEYRFRNFRVLDCTVGFRQGGGVGGVYCDLEFNGNSKHYVIDRTISNENNRETFFSANTVFDLTPENGIGLSIEDTTTTGATQPYVRAAGTWFASADEALIKVAASVQGTLELDGCRLFNAGQTHVLGSGDGIKCASTLIYINIDGCNFEQNEGTAFNQTAANSRISMKDARFRSNGDDVSANVISSGASYNYVSGFYVFATDPSLELYSFNPTTGEGPAVKFFSNEGTEDSPSAVVNGSMMGTVDFKGWDGNSYNIGAYLEAVIDTTPGAVADGYTPTKLTFAFDNVGGSYTQTLVLDEDSATFGANAIVASGKRLGIGEVSPDAPVHINSGTADTGLIIESTDAASDAVFVDSIGSVRLRHTSGTFAFFTGGAAGSAIASGSSQVISFGTSAFNSDIPIKLGATGGEGGELRFENTAGTAVAYTIDVDGSDNWRLRDSGGTVLSHDGINIIHTDPVRLPVYTVATLPAATAQGQKAFVTDANATTFASVVAGGGANFVPVFSDGTNWRIG